MIDDRTDSSHSMGLPDISRLDSLTRQAEEKSKNNPQILPSLWTHGNSYDQRGKINTAVQTPGPAVQVNPRSPRAFNYHGVSWYRQGQANDAEVTLRRATGLSLIFSMAYDWHATNHWRQNSYRQTGETFEILRKKNAESPIAHYHAAPACIEEKDYDGDLAHLQALAAIIHNDSRL